MKPVSVEALSITGGLLVCRRQDLSCTTGREDGSTIRIVIGKGEKSLAFARREDVMFEYERKSVHGWGHTAPGGVLHGEGVAHFLPTDKVRKGTTKPREADRVVEGVPESQHTPSVRPPLHDH